jgi:hypothetical protein
MANDPTAAIITLAGAMVSDLNAQVAVKDESGNAITSRFTAVRKYRAEYKPADMQSVRVDVVTPMFSPSLDDRATWTISNQQLGLSIWVFVQKCVDSRDITNLDLLLNLSARIAQRYPQGLAPTTLHAGTHPEMNTALSANTPYQVQSSEIEIYDYRLLVDSEQGFGIWRSVIKTEWIKL